jgi:hypothetical protein
MQMNTKLGLTILCILSIFGQFTFSVTKIETVDLASYQIVISDTKNSVLDRAGDEFRNFAQKMTGKNFSNVKYSNTLPKDGDIIVIGKATSPLIANYIKLNLIPNLLVDGYDRFNVASCAQKGQRILFFYGESDISVLYAVYTYLENKCGVGFFQDGNYVPSLTNLPFEDIVIKESSPFEKRFVFSWHGWEIPKKFHACFWTYDEWKSFIDWSVRKKYNVIRMEFNPIITKSIGDIIDLAVPENKSKDCGSWNGKYRRELNKKIINYAHSNGLKIAFVMQYAMWPEDFTLLEKTGTWFSRADDPNTMKYTKRVWKKFKEEYGSDNIYVLAYAGETPKLKKQIAMGYQQGYDILKSLSPKAEIWLDGWGFFFTAFSKEDYDEFDALVPKDIGVLDFLGYNDYASDQHRAGMYRYYNRYNGRKWGMIYVTNFSGEDTSHIEPNLQYYCDNIRNLKNETKRGLNVVSYMPENVGGNLLVADYFARLMWNPNDIDANSYLNEYLKCRYGIKESSDLAKGLKLWISGMEKFKKTNGMAVREFGDTLSPMVEILQCFQKENSPHSVKQTAVKPLLVCLQSYLECSDKDVNLYQNPLFQKDLVEIFKLYSQELYYLPMMRLADSYYTAILGNSGQDEIKKTSELIESERIKLKVLYEGLESVLSSQEDYSLYEDLREISSVSESKPGLEQFLKWKHIMDVDKYARNMAWETVHFVYWPEQDAYIQRILDAMANGSKEVIKADDKLLNDKWKEIRDNFANANIQLEQNPYLTGITASKSSDVIKTVLEKYTQAKLSPSDYNDLYSDENKLHYFPFVNPSAIK